MFGVGAGAGAGIWRTACDWRPTERLPPSGRAKASATIEKALTARIVVTRNFFIVSSLK